MTGHPGSDRARRVGIALLGWYPRPWRMRYEQEMRALLEDMPVSWRQVANLAGTAIREWLSPRAFGWPARTAAGRLSLIRAMSFFVCAYALDGIARVVAAKLAQAGIKISDSAGTVAAAVSVVFALRVLLEFITRLSKKPWAVRMRQRRSSWTQLRDWEIVVWALLMFPSMVVEHSPSIPSYLSPTMVAIKPYVSLIRVFVWTNLALQSSRRWIRLQRIQSSALKRRHRAQLETYRSSLPKHWS